MYTYIYIYIYTYIYIYIYIYTYIYTYIYIHIYICMYACMCVRVCKYVCMCVCVFVCVFFMCRQIYIYTYIDICIFIYLLNLIHVFSAFARQTLQWEGSLAEFEKASSVRSRYEEVLVWCKLYAPVPGGLGSGRSFVLVFLSFHLRGGAVAG